MPARYKAVELRPPQGGKLIGGLSEDTGAEPNYSVKKNFRRDLDVEMRREGWSLFNPKFDKNPLNMPLYEDDDVTLFFQFSRPNGNTALLAAAGDKLYRLFANDDLADYMKTEWVYPDAGRGDAYHSGGEFSFNWKIIKDGITVPGSLRRIELLSEGEYFREDSMVRVLVDGPGDATGVVSDPEVVQPQGEDAPSISGTYTAKVRRNYTVQVRLNKYSLYRGGGELKTPLIENEDIPITARPFDHGMSITFPRSSYPEEEQFQFVAKPRRVGEIIITDKGKSYTRPPEVTIEDATGNGTGARAVAHLHENNRWEAVALNGYAVCNNGSDLPYVYREEWEEAQQLYALRELGIVSVGCIAESGGYLVLADLAEFAEGELERWAVICDDKGIDPYSHVTPELISEHNLIVNETQYAVLWSAAGDPTQFGASSLGAIVATDNRWYPKYPNLVRSFEEGQQFVISGAGPLNGNLATKITKIVKGNEGDIHYFELEDSASAPGHPSESEAPSAPSDLTAAVTTDSLNIRTPYVHLDTPGFSNVVGGSSVEILGDGSRILKMEKLMDTLIIYRQTGYWMAQLTSSTTDPFSFTERYTGNRAALFRHSVANIVDKYHIFVGLHGVFKIDLTEAEPSWVGAFQIGPQFWKELSLYDQETVFSYDNALTGETWLCLPKEMGDNATLAYDYRTNTLSHIDHHFTAGLTIRRPQNPFTERSDDMVILSYDGTVFTYGYGYGDIPSVFSRVNEEYTSVIQSTLMNFKDRFNEKDIRSYVLLLDQTNPAIGTRMELFTQGSLLDEKVLVVDHAIEDLDDETMVPVWSRALFYKDRVTVSGKDNPLRLASRIFEVSDVMSRSQTQTQGEGYGGGGGGGGQGNA